MSQSLLKNTNLTLLKLRYISYEAKHESRLLEIFRSNCPKYFDPDDEGEFLAFLRTYTNENYLVVLRNEKPIACGGHYTKGKRHGIAWAMFERNVLGSRSLLKACDDFFKEILRRIENEATSFDIYINTSQLMEGFFSR